MKNLIFALLIICLITPAALAESQKSFQSKKWTEVKDCFRYKLTDVHDTKGRYVETIMIIDTAKQLTNKVGEVAKSQAEAAKVCNKIGKKIHGRVKNKDRHPGVSHVLISARQIAVKIWPYPGDWTKIQPKVIEEIISVLCRK